jgi:hypothetical protein
VRSRRDLRRINALMMNSTLVVRELRRAFPGKPPRVIAEVGAGDGHFLLQVANKLRQWRDLDAILLDRQPVVSSATVEKFAAIGWRAQAVAADAGAWLAQPAGRAPDVIVANLFLHHFDTAGLSELLRQLAQRTRVLIACEPRRSRGALLGSHLLGLIGCNDVTRHDAVVSVRAGFSNEELTSLWPARAAWTLREHGYGLFSHCFVATRSGNDADAAAAELAP